MKKIILSGLFFAFIAFIGCKENTKNNTVTEGEDTVEKITIKHELGTAEVVKNPKTVVLLDYSSIDSFDRLGIKIAGLPKGNLPSYLEKYNSDNSIVDIGDLMRPNFEKINELSPDLIVISARQAKIYKELSEIAPTVYLGVDQNNYHESFERNARQIGEIFDKETEVNKELKKINTKISEIAKITETSDKTALIILVNEGRYSAYGKGSRFGIIHDVFGLKQADPKIEVATHGQPISNEFIQTTNPDYLFVIDRGSAIKRGTMDKETFSNKLIAQTNAYKNDKIIFLSSDVWYLSGAGLESIEIMADEIAKAIK